MQMCTVVRMMCCTAFATFFLLGVASGQTSLQISSCLTKDQNLQMSCKFVPATDPKLLKTCYYMTENKLIGHSNSSITPDSTFKNRANVSISNTTCELYLKGFSADKPTNYTCFIKQTASPVSVVATVDKSKLQTCSAWCVVQHSGAALLLAFLTFPLLSELL
ncbi:thy-1 membrane glycoprotein [Rhinichthys klamathensis goyatoka]|uniref:thy-1 membrane glycoprotein n=1 Tax=Rhinichthys klamathensis goyatoka TaxID=3034132 RepID=UPI0024B504BF|nr:thy-1 membrane glycoprotein [Rhinichthys klamathensis goyatoka]